MPSLNRLVKHAHLTLTLVGKSLGRRTASKRQWKWQRELLDHATVACASPKLEGLTILAGRTAYFLMRRCRRKEVRKNGLKHWERTLLASALAALGRPPSTLPGSQPVVKKPSLNRPWYHAIFDEYPTGCLGREAEAFVVAARVCQGLRKVSRPVEPHVFLSARGDLDTLRSLHAQLGQRVEEMAAEANEVAARWAAGILNP